MNRIAYRLRFLSAQPILGRVRNVRHLAGSVKHDLEALRNTLTKRASGAGQDTGAVVLATKSDSSSRDVAVKQYASNSVGAPADFVEPAATRRFNNVLSVWAVLAATGLLALWFVGPAQAKQQQSALHVSARELRFLRRRARKALLMCFTKVDHGRADKLDVFMSAFKLDAHREAPTVLCYAADGETASSWGLVAALLQPHARVLCVARSMPPDHDSRLGRQACASQAADMEYACQVAGVTGPVITVTSGVSSFASALFQARAATGLIPGVAAGRMLALDPQWMPDTLRSKHVPAVVAASRQLHQPGLLERLQVAPQQRDRDALGQLTPSSVLGKGLDIAQRLTGGAQSDLGQKGDRGVAAMNQRQPLLAPDDVGILREVLASCAQPLRCTQLLTAPGALPFNVSAVDNAQVFTLRTHGAGMLSQALHGNWAAAAPAPDAARAAMEEAAQACRKQLQDKANAADGPEAIAAAQRMYQGDIATVAGIKAAMRPVQSLLIMAAAAAGLLPTADIKEVKAAQHDLQKIASEDAVFLLEPVEANVYHVPLQAPAAVLQALAPHLPGAQETATPYASLLRTISPLSG